MFPEEFCAFECMLDHTEWNITYDGKTFNAGSESTTFQYTVTISDNLPDIACGTNTEPQGLDFISIRLGCNCNPDTKIFLKSITRSLDPYGSTEDLFWCWYPENMAAGESVLVEITLTGSEEIPIGYGDVTLGGGKRCVSVQNIAVPDPCASTCLQGQWADWNEWGDCSATW